MGYLVQCLFLAINPPIATASGLQSRKCTISVRDYLRLFSKVCDFPTLRLSTGLEIPYDSPVIGRVHNSINSQTLQTKH
jgi:hypothetical protein